MYRITSALQEQKDSRTYSVNVFGSPDSGICKFLHSIFVLRSGIFPRHPTHLTNRVWQILKGSSRAGIAVLFGSRSQQALFCAVRNLGKPREA